MALAKTYQLISVISLLSAEVPDLNSPANVDAAKEVREDFPCERHQLFPLLLVTFGPATQSTVVRMTADGVASVQEEGEAASTKVCGGGI